MAGALIMSPMKTILRTCYAVLLSSVMLWGAPASVWAVDLHPIQSRLKALGHGYHSQAEWDTVLQEIDRLASQAGQEGQTAQLIELNVLQAMVYGDMRKDYHRAQSILEATKDRYGHLDLPEVRRVYGRLAETYARLGDVQAVNALIKEFEKSPAYDPEFYTFSGGHGPTDPVLLTRPSAYAKDSITVTAMESQRAKAKLATGTLFPDLQGTDLRGRRVRLWDYRGHVTLVDFWVRNWYPWERQLPHLLQTYHDYHSKGFEIIGICLDRDTAGLSDYLGRQNIPWRQIAGDRELPKQYGVYGEATSFLLDENGVIIGCDLTGSDLVEAIKSAL